MVSLEGVHHAEEGASRGGINELVDRRIWVLVAMLVQVGEVNEHSPPTPGMTTRLETHFVYCISMMYDVFSVQKLLHLYVNDFHLRGRGWM